MTTISVTKNVKKQLLEFASELQIMLGRRVDFNEAIEFLLSQRQAKNPGLFREACKPAPGAEEAIEELLKERKTDEERARRRLSA
ncbi:MAG: hypothetical protein ACE5PM_09585 [Candidatus Hydrothermarchaeales archaeon]